MLQMQGCLNIYRKEMKMVFLLVQWPLAQTCGPLLWMLVLGILLKFMNSLHFSCIRYVVFTKADCSSYVLYFIIVYQNLPLLISLLINLLGTPLL
jgi:hypothetical protein